MSAFSEGVRLDETRGYGMEREICAYLNEGCCCQDMMSMAEFQEMVEKGRRWGSVGNLIAIPRLAS